MAYHSCIPGFSESVSVLRCFVGRTNYGDGTISQKGINEADEYLKKHSDSIHPTCVLSILAWYMIPRSRWAVKPDLGLSYDLDHPERNDEDQILAIINFLVSRGGDVNRARTTLAKGQRTLLHIAVLWNSLNLVQILVLNHGHFVSPEDKKGNTPLHVAYNLGYMNIVEFLLSLTSNPNQTNSRGHTFFHPITNAYSRTYAENLRRVITICPTIDLTIKRNLRARGPNPSTRVEIDFRPPIGFSETIFFTEPRSILAWTQKDISYTVFHLWSTKFAYFFCFAETCLLKEVKQLILGFLGIDLAFIEDVLGEVRGALVKDLCGMWGLDQIPEKFWDCGLGLKWKQKKQRENAMLD